MLELGLPTFLCFSCAVQASGLLFIAISYSFLVLGSSEEL